LDGEAAPVMNAEFAATVASVDVSAIASSLESA
jgi:hypothetical protein